MKRRDVDIGGTSDRKWQRNILSRGEWKSREKGRVIKGKEERRRD